MRVNRCCGVFVGKLQKYRYKLSNWLQKAEKLSLSKTLMAEPTTKQVLAWRSGNVFVYGTYFYKVLGSLEPPQSRAPVETHIRCLRSERCLLSTTNSYQPRLAGPDSTAAHSRQRSLCLWWFCVLYRWLFQWRNAEELPLARWLG